MNSLAIEDHGIVGDLRSVALVGTDGSIDFAVKFSGPTDPRFLATLERIEDDLVVDSLVQRYPADGSDGVTGSEGTFNLCSFWYVEALTRAERLDDARNVLEKAFTYANHVGLYAEELSASGEHLGDFPQALTHLGLISAAVNLDRAMG